MPECVTEWVGLYDGSWRGLIVDEAYSHPAKYARNLIRRIYEHLRDHYGLPPGSVVVDPFGGVALGALDAMECGYWYIGIELERRFHWLGAGGDCPGFTRENWRRFYARGPECFERWLKLPLCPDCQKAWQPAKYDFRDDHGMFHAREIPHREAHHFTGNLDMFRAGHPGASAVLIHGDSRELRRHVGEAAVVLGSPPFAESLATNIHTIGFENVTGNCHRKPGHTSPSEVRQDYGSSPGQLGALPPGSVQAVVGSPPYEGNVKHDYRMSEDGKTRDRDLRRGYTQGQGCFRGSEAYGDTEGQLGREESTTFWSAAKSICEACFDVLRPGGLCAWVVKSFVRAGAIVDFPGDWRRLCESVGFVLVEEVHASLVKTHEHPGLFGEPVVKKKARLSFFRRLHQKKYPHLAIDYEVVLFLRKPGGGGGGGAACVGSPPFMENNVNIGAVGDTPAMRQQIHSSRKRDDSYGRTEGQLAAMPAGSVDAVIGSPPFMENNPERGGTQGKGAYAGTDLSQGRNRVKDDYAKYETDGNLAALPPGHVEDVLQ